MTDMVTKLLAKIEEAEQLAQAAFDEIETALKEPEDERALVYPGQFAAWFEHADANRPSVVLRLCQAHRQIISEYQRLNVEWDAARVTPPDVAVFVALGTQVRTLMAVIKSLAEGYCIKEES
jgi:hypothetical protein